MRGFPAFLDRQDPILGLVRLCRGCGEEWPKDEEFWYFDRDGRVLGRCRACWSERRRGDDGSPERFGPMAVAS